MKGILYFFGGCLVIGLILSFTISNMPALQMAGKSILVLLSQKQYQQAYNFFSNDFKSRHDLKEFTQMVEQSGLSNYEGVEWTREVQSKDKKKGYLAGVVKTTQNSEIAIEIDYVNEIPEGAFGQQWLINNLRVKKQNAIAAPPTQRPAP